MRKEKLLQEMDRNDQEERQTKQSIRLSGKMAEKQLIRLSGKMAEKSRSDCQARWQKKVDQTVRQDGRKKSIRLLDKMAENREKR